MVRGPVVVADRPEHLSDDDEFGRDDRVSVWPLPFADAVKALVRAPAKKGGDDGDGV